MAVDTGASELIQQVDKVITAALGQRGHSDEGTATEPLVVGVSGGPDSMALLHAMAELAPTRHWRPVVAHLDHGMRPESADEAAFVSRVAHGLGLEVALGAVDVPALAARTGASLETAARNARYGFLAREALEVGAQLILVAHHSDDQVETILMNLIRGAGPAGLAGMDGVSRLPYDESVAQRHLLDAATGVEGSGPAVRELRLVRPLLNLAKADILAFLAHREAEYVKDPSNEDPAFLRNRIRHEILPALESVNPQVRAALLRAGQIARDDAAVLDEAVDEAWGRAVIDDRERVEFGLVAWESLMPALQRRLLRRAVQHLEGDLRDTGLDHIESARRFAAGATAGSRLDLPGRLCVTRAYTTFALEHARPKVPEAGLGAEPKSLAVSGQVELPGGWLVGVEWRERTPVDPPTVREPWRAVLDADGCRGLEVRARQPGDSIQPLGMVGRKSLQDVYVDSRVPRHLRDGWPVLVAQGGGNGVVVWLPGLKLSEAAKVRPDTRRVVDITVRPPPEAARVI